METVYIVTDGHDDYYHIDSVFANEEKARAKVKFLKKIGKIDESNLQYIKMQLDDDKELLPLIKVYQVRFKLDIIYRQFLQSKIKDTKNLNKSLVSLSTKQRKNLEQSISVEHTLTKIFSTCIDTDSLKTFYVVKGDEIVDGINISPIDDVLADIKDILDLPIYKNSWDKSTLLIYYCHSNKSKKDTMNMAQKCIQAIDKFLISKGFEKKS